MEASDQLCLQMARYRLTSWLGLQSCTISWNCSQKTNGCIVESQEPARYRAKYCCFPEEKLNAASMGDIQGGTGVQVLVVVTPGSQRTLSDQGLVSQHVPISLVSKGNKLYLLRKFLNIRLLMVYVTSSRWLESSKLGLQRSILQHGHASTFFQDREPWACGQLTLIQDSKVHKCHTICAYQDQVQLLETEIRNTSGLDNREVYFLSYKINRDSQISSELIYRPLLPWPKMVSGVPVITSVF